VNLRDRVTLITGGARIGQAVAKALADRGSHLILTYRSSKKSAEESIAYARSKGRKAFSLKTDLTLNQSYADTISQVKRVFGRLDILINMASVYQETPLERLDSKIWDHNFAANFKHMYGLSLKAAPLLRKHGGRIINFTDWTVASGRPRYKNLVAYYTAKAAVIGLTEALALEFAPDILVNAIAPGPIMPPAKGIRSSENKEILKNTPLKKWGGASEIAKAVLFLIESDFLTGECIRVDGGRHLY